MRGLAVTGLASSIGNLHEIFLPRASRGGALNERHATRTTLVETVDSHENTSLLKIKNLLTEEDQEARYEHFVIQCFTLSDVRTYTIKYNIIPKSQDWPDILFVSGNRTAPMISFLHMNERLVRSVPKIALGKDFGPIDRAALLNAGFDDAFNLGTYNPPDAAAKVLSIRERCQKTLRDQQLGKDKCPQLSDFCDPDRLSFTQKKLLNSLIEAPDNFCSYRKLAIVVSRYGKKVSTVHIRVLIWQIRSLLYDGYTIVNEQREGYRLLAVSNVAPIRRHGSSA